MNTIRKKDLGFSTAKSGAVPCRVLKDSMLMEYTTKTSPQQQERQKQEQQPVVVESAPTAAKPSAGEEMLSLPDNLKPLPALSMLPDRAAYRKYRNRQPSEATTPLPPLVEDARHGAQTARERSSPRRRRAG